MKILANDGISPAGKQALAEAGFEVLTDKVEQAGIAAFMNEHNVSALLVRSATTVRQDLIDSVPGLKLIGRGGVGMDNIDVSYARSKGIEVINTPASSSQSVAELVMGHLFSIVRGLYDANRQMPVNGATQFKELKKKYGKGIELRGKTIGIIGFGRIGQSVASYALGCGMKVIAVDLIPGNRQIDFEIPGHGTVSITIPVRTMEDSLPVCDFFSLHVPKQPDGTPVIGKAELAKMKDGVILVNTARGGSIDEDALLEALNSGKVAGAGIDVFENEPTPRPDLLSHSKLSLSPHVGAATLEAQDRIGLELAEKIVSILGSTVKS